MGAEAELDEGAGVGGQFGLPAVVSLILLHGRLGGGIPLPGGRRSEIVLADEGILNFAGALRLNLALALDGVVVAAVVMAAGGGSTMGPRGEGRRGGQEHRQNNNRQGP